MKYAYNEELDITEANLLTITLPSKVPIGAVFELCFFTPYGWEVRCGKNQLIELKDQQITRMSTGITETSLNHRIRLRCLKENIFFKVEVMTGNFRTF